MKTIIIAAMAANRVIGKNNKTPWHIGEELQRFKATTMGHTIIMGRKTYDSINRKLPGRTNIIISRNKNLTIKDCLICHSLHEAINLSKNQEKVFIIGGGEIYSQAMNIADSIILTILDRTINGDTFFPEVPTKKFKETSRTRTENDEPYTIIKYEKT